MKRVKTKYVGVYTREGLSRLGINGKPDICYDITYKKDGKTIFEKIGWKSEGYTAEDAVEICGNRVKLQRHPGLTSNIKNITLEDAWAVYSTRWLPTIKSAKGLQRRYEVYILPYFKRRTLQSITKFEIQQFVGELLAKPIVTTKSGHLSACTVSKVIELLNGLYSKMLEWELLSDGNFPTKNIKIPNSKMKRERYLQAQEAVRLLDHLKHNISSQHYFIAKIGIYTGMRLQEILSLSATQVDLSARIMSIDGKTGNRTVFIAEQLIPDLEKLMSAASDGLLIHIDGKPITRTAATKRFIRIFDAMGLNDGVTDKKNKLVFHSLRHTFCSWLAMQGVSLYTIGSLAGHSNADTTQRYAKLSASVQHEALKNIDKMMERGNG